MSKELVLSNDSTGVFGTSQTFEKVWGFIKDEHAINFGGIEAVGWKWLPLLIPGYQHIEVKVKGVHGKTGGIHEAYNVFDRLKLGSLNKILLPNVNLIELNGIVDYILVHSPQIIKLKERKLIHSLKNAIKTFYVENHLHTGALDSARANVNSLRLAGVNAGLMIDWGHVVTSEFNHTNDFNTGFIQSVDTVRRNILELQKVDVNIPISFHLPMGKSDCLPMDLMTADHWKMIADTVDLSNNGFVVVENQQAVYESFLLSHNMALKQRFENEKRLQLIKDHKII